ncbi:(2Fe-2S)-binding protein [Chitinibacteraceae bacterium HSL-7]
MIVCICNNVSDKTIRREVKNGVRTLRELTVSHGVAACCGQCASCAREVICDAIEEEAAREWATMDAMAMA